MSFGFGVGDVLAVLKLANKVRKDFFGAPKQVQDVCDEVRNLSIVLSDVDVTVSECELTQAQQNDLAEILSSCQTVLQDLEQVLGKFTELSSTNDPSLGMRARRVWKQLKWEPGDIRELRERIVSVVSLLHAYLGGISSRAILATQKGVDRLNEREDDKTRSEILNWLTPTEYATQQHDFINRKQEGTGRWLLDSTEYQTWIDPTSDQRTLFCPGMPGAGKTILTAIVIDDLLTRFASGLASLDIGIAYIYFNFRRHDQQRYPEVMLSVLKQLCQSLPSLPCFLADLWNSHKKKQTRPTAGDIVRGLEEVVQAYANRVFIVVDAVDESSSNDGTRSRVLKELLRLQDESSTPLLLFATSRYMPDIMETFRSRSTTISVDIRASRHDIEQYVDGNIGTLLPFVRRNLALQTEIKDAISEAVDGMFLLAQIYLHSLGDKTTPKSVRTTLTDFKERNSGSSEASKVQTLRRAYDDAMVRIVGQRPGFKDLALRALSWISCATRPLTTVELQHALAVEIGAPELDYDNMPEVDDILGACAGLVTVDEESDIIRLVHYTTQEYLENTRSQWLPDAEDDITRISATYLSFQVFSSGPCRSAGELRRRNRRNPLYPLVALSFAHYASRASRVWPEVVDFFELKPNARAAYQYCVSDKICRNLTVFGLSWLEIVQLATYFGLVDVVDSFLRQGYLNTGTKEEPGKAQDSALNRDDSIPSSLVGIHPWLAFKVSNQTPLHVASTWGHIEIARLLLARPGIDVNALDSRGSTPLHEAAIMGHGETVELLLSCSEIEINRRDANGNTPLHCAACGKQAGVARILLSRPGILVNARNNTGSTPLLFHLAAQWCDSQLDVMEVLLNAPDIDIHAVDDNGDTALSFAVFSGPHPVKRLIRCWTAKASAQWQYSGTKALQRASRGNQVEIVEMLLADDRLGIDLAADVGRDSAISTAAVWNRVDIVRVLLDTAQIPVSEQERVMFMAAARGLAVVVKLFIERGAVSTGITDSTGRTPLEVARRH
ncbi:hypothetical protein QBC37DRAFT_389070 [Rhypophila decipiens]|uniref:NACHT domain-containing protein n=1 Tax=Rhypophila decipiens TaxID=261697 RepID=A0AAN7B475_9PEZI|nr:hypothetical protein QBC37DRAFT_389070 [Rhypophila decipiens]